MKKQMIIVGGALALALSGIGATSAIAATMTSSPTSGAVSTPPATNGSSTTPDPGTAQAQEPTGTEASDAAEAPGTEKPGAGDGNDGGHADPAGVDVNHEGSANEK